MQITSSTSKDHHKSVADLRGARGMHAPPPGGPNSFNSMQFFGKIWQNHMLPPPGLAPPPWGNPGSATANIIFVNITGNRD